MTNNMNLGQLLSEQLKSRIVRIWMFLFNPLNLGAPVLPHSLDDNTIVPDGSTFHSCSKFQFFRTIMPLEMNDKTYCILHVSNYLVD